MREYICQNCDYREQEPNDEDERTKWRCPQCGIMNNYEDK
jgi:DNA-directed RNA polymerase subunit RPC12/RpoP